MASLKHIAFIMLLWQSGFGQSEHFVTTWETSDSYPAVTIPTNSAAYTYSYDVDWDNDGTFDDTGVTADITHDYGGAGTHTIRIRGTFPHFYLNNNTIGKWQLREVNQWGNIAWSDMNKAFYGASYLTIPATDTPDLSSVTNMSFMFYGATLFNQDICGWDVSAVTNMYAMFYNATSFDQSLGDWVLNSPVNMDHMLTYTALSNDNYGNTLIGWAGGASVPIDVTFRADNLTFCSAEAGNARHTLTSTYNWSIFDLGMDVSCIPSDEFVTTWITISGNTEITIPTNSSYTYSYDIDWDNDGVFDLTGQTGDVTSSFGSIFGTRRVRIKGIFPAIYVNYYADKNLLSEVNQWGDIAWSSMKNAFYGASNLTIPATDSPDLSSVTDMQFMFANALAFNQDMSLWDVSAVTNMSYMFNGATSFNQDISDWDVSAVTNMTHMFHDATSFNQSIGAWSVSAAANMSYMLKNASSFNQYIGDWSVGAVTNMASMFQGASSFNQDISGWDVSAVTDMSFMFCLATSFNQNIGNWSVSAVTNMNYMFSGATSFNQDMSGWDVSAVTVMSYMFRNASSFDQNLGDWVLNNSVILISMLYDSGLSSESYGNTLIGWAGQAINDRNLGSAAPLTYCAGAPEVARADLIDNHGWTINDSGVDNTCNIALATAWLSFEAKPIENKQVVLLWRIEAVDGDTEFGIYRSVDSRSWEQIGRVNSSDQGFRKVTFTYIDTDANTGENYYRITMIDANGNRSQSGIRRVLIDGENVVTLYPNPAVHTIRLSGYDQASGSIKVLDALVRDFSMAVHSNHDGLNERVLDISQLLPGMYFLYLNDQVLSFYKN